MTPFASVAGGAGRRSVAGHSAIAGTKSQAMAQSGRTEMGSRMSALGGEAGIC
jgi:hypothetical protein